PANNDRNKVVYFISTQFACKMCAETYYFQQLFIINHVDYLIGGESANIKMKKNEKNKNI
ncbi:MAG: hypothetical protein ACYSUX_04290, partial [Planctomycetota bacterium]